MRLALAVVMLTGCHRLLDLQELHPSNTADANTGDGGADSHVVNDASADGALDPKRYISPGDYDNDGTPNAQDPCPHLPTVTSTMGTTDSDNDGLPDACDPNYNAPSADCIVLFESFVGHTLDPRWHERGGWTLTTCGGTLGMCSPTGGAPSLLWFDQAWPIAAVESHTIADVAAPGTELEVYASLDPGSAGDMVTGRACGIQTNGGTGLGVVYMADRNMGQATKTVSTVLVAFSTGSPTRLRFRTPTTCIVNGSGVFNAPATSIPPRALGVRVAAGRFALTYLLAYKASCP